MTTPSNHTQRRQPQVRNMQPADRVTPRPKPSTCHSTPNRRARQETMPNSRSAKFGRILQNATGFDEPQRKLVHARAHAREGQRVPLDFSRHGLRPGHSGLDTSLGIAVSSPSCQQIERNRFGAFSLVRERASRLPVGDTCPSGISHIMAPQHLDNILK